MAFSTGGLVKGYDVEGPNDPRLAISADALAQPIEIDGDVDWHGYALQNLKNPVNNADAVNKAYVDSMVHPTSVFPNFVNNAYLYYDGNDLSFKPLTIADIAGLETRLQDITPSVLRLVDSTPFAGDGRVGDIRIVADRGIIVEKVDAQNNYADYPNNAEDYIRFEEKAKAQNVNALGVHVRLTDNAPSASLERESTLEGVITEYLSLHIQANRTTLNDITNLLTFYRDPVSGANTIDQAFSWSIVGDGTQTVSEALKETLRGADVERWERKWPIWLEGQFAIGNANGDLVPFANGNVDQYITIDADGNLLWKDLPESDSLPDRAGNAGKALFTDGADDMWQDIAIADVDGLQAALNAKGEALPAYAGNAGKFFGTDGATGSWESITIADVENLQSSLDGILPAEAGNAGKYLKVNAAADAYELDTLTVADIGGLDNRLLPAALGNAGQVAKVNQAGTGVIWGADNAGQGGGQAYVLPADRTVIHGDALPDPAVDENLFVDIDNGIWYYAAGTRQAGEVVFASGGKNATVKFIETPRAPRNMEVRLVSDPAEADDGNLNVGDSYVQYTFKPGTTTVANMIEDFAFAGFVSASATGDQTTVLEAGDAQTLQLTSENVPSWNHMSPGELFSDLNAGKNWINFETRDNPETIGDVGIFAKVFGSNSTLFSKTTNGAARRLDCQIYSSDVANTVANAASNAAGGWTYGSVPGDIALNMADGKMWSLDDNSVWQEIILDSMPDFGAADENKFLQVYQKGDGTYALRWQEETAAPTSLTDIDDITFDSGGKITDRAAYLEIESAANRNIEINANAAIADAIQLTAGGNGFVGVRVGDAASGLQRISSWTKDAMDMHEKPIRQFYGFTDLEGYPGFRFDYDRTAVANIYRTNNGPAVKGGSTDRYFSSVAAAIRQVGFSIPAGNLEGKVLASITLKIERNAIDVAGKLFVEVRNSDGELRFKSAEQDIGNMAVGVATNATQNIRFDFDTFMVLAEGDQLRLTSNITAGGAAALLNAYAPEDNGSTYPIEMWNAAGVKTDDENQTLWFIMATHEGRVALHVEDRHDCVVLEPHPDYSPVDTCVLIQAAKKGNVQVNSPVQVQQGAVDYAANVVIDFDGPPTQVISLTGDITLSSKNRGAGKVIHLILNNATAVQRTLTVNAGWFHNGATDNTSLAGNTRTHVWIHCEGNDESDVSAIHAELVS